LAHAPKVLVARFASTQVPRALFKMQVAADPKNFAKSLARTFVTKMPPEEIETATLAAHKLQLKDLRDFAVLEFNSDAYLVWTWSNYMQTQNAEKKFQMQAWTRPLDTILCKILPLEQANVREHPTEKSGFFSVKKIKEKERPKLEYMAGRMGGGEKSIEDFPRYADHFAHLFGDHYISSTQEHYQNTCAECFGKWAPDVRTAHEIGGPIARMVQVPPSVREKLTGRMQSERTIDGKAYLCHECGDPRPLEQKDSKYCSYACAAIYVSEIVCSCGNKVFQQSSNGTFPVKHCPNCKKIVWMRPRGMAERGWWLIRQQGLTAQAPEGHIPKWTKKRKLGSGEDITAGDSGAVEEGTTSGASSAKRRKRK